MSFAGRTYSSAARGAVAAGLIVACAAAAFAGIRATHDLTWPGGSDFSRDIAIAESIAHGHPLSDPFYQGEWAWYNPLVPGMVAGLASLTHQPIPVMYARAGAYLNLLAPVCLFAFMSVVFDPLTALAAVIGFLFLLPGAEPAWLRATYSPWLLPAHFMQAVFYLTLILIWRACKDDRASVWAIAGAATGLVFLGHTAPALILVGLVTTWTAGRLIAQPADRRRAFRNWSTFGAAAAVVALPLLISIAGHYHLATRNRFPADYVAPGLELSRLNRFLGDEFAPTSGAVIVTIGLIGLAVRHRRSESRLLIAGSVLTAGLLTYSYATQYAQTSGGRLPALVPGWHFLFYLRAFEAMVFGIGAVTAADGVVALIDRVRGVPATRSAGPAIRALILVCLAGCAVASYGTYLRRSDFIGERWSAQQMFTAPELVKMYEWIQRSTRYSDVFLAEDNLGLSVVATAGRKVVAVERFFSNPYVDWRRRSHDRDEMMALLSRGDWAGFTTIAFEYRVRYIATNRRVPVDLEQPCCLSKTWSAGEWRIYRVGGE